MVLLKRQNQLAAIWKNRVNFYNFARRYKVPLFQDTEKTIIKHHGTSI